MDKVRFCKAGAIKTPAVAAAGVLSLETGIANQVRTGLAARRLHDDAGRGDGDGARRHSLT
jgi:hypothetical protein